MLNMKQQISLWIFLGFCQLNAVLAQSFVTLPAAPTPLPDANFTALSNGSFAETWGNFSVGDPWPINCHQRQTPDQPQTNIPGCRPGLRILRQFPNYGLRQTFRQLGDRGRPERPFPPPYGLDVPEATCGIIINSYQDDVTGFFSFRDAYNLAIRILEHCEPSGFGGNSLIGDPMPGSIASGWSVNVVPLPIPRAVSQASNFTQALGTKVPDTY